MGILDKIRKSSAKTDDKAQALHEKKAEEKAKSKPEAQPQAKDSAGAADEKKSKKPASKPARKSGRKASASRPTATKEHGGKSVNVLLEPVLTEKASRQENLGKYSFFVASGATKVDVAEAVRDLYGIRPFSVRIVNVLGKKVSFGRRQGKRKDRKKAIVTLRSGDSISFTE
jgi:large subunit ribosomal protein L23